MVDGVHLVRPGAPCGSLGSLRFVDGFSLFVAWFVLVCLVRPCAIGVARFVRFRLVRLGSPLGSLSSFRIASLGLFRFFWFVRVRP